MTDISLGSFDSFSYYYIVYGLFFSEYYTQALFEHFLLDQLPLGISMVRRVERSAERAADLVMRVLCRMKEEDELSPPVVPRRIICRLPLPISVWSGNFCASPLSARCPPVKRTIRARMITDFSFAVFFWLM